MHRIATRLTQLETREHACNGYILVNLRHVTPEEEERVLADAREQACAAHKFLIVVQYEDWHSDEFEQETET